MSRLRAYRRRGEPVGQDLADQQHQPMSSATWSEFFHVQSNACWIRVVRVFMVAPIGRN